MSLTAVRLANTHTLYSAREYQLASHWLQQVFVRVYELAARASGSHAARRIQWFRLLQPSVSLGPGV